MSDPSDEVDDDADDIVDELVERAKAPISARNREPEVKKAYVEPPDARGPGYGRDYRGQENRGMTRAQSETRDARAGIAASAAAVDKATRAVESLKGTLKK